MRGSANSHTPFRFASTTLLLGNFITGLSIYAPAGMLNELSAGLSVSIQEAGLLVTFGAIVLCFGSPLMAWLTSHMERRTLLVGVLLIVTLGNAVSTFAPGYWSLMVFRLILLAVAAVYTPQAASTVVLIVTERQRAAAIAYIFLGWSIAVAGGLPLVTFLADTFGWREVYGALAALGAAVSAMLWFTLPGGLLGSPLSFASWARLERSSYILLLLLNTAIRTSGQFVVITYLAPLLVRTAGAGSKTIGLFFAIFGICGVIGNMAATTFVDSVGAYRMSMIFAASMLLGAVLWLVGSGALVIMAAGIGFVGLGFASANSMQQGRLVQAAPELASASVALNTSAIYVGQAVGSALGGWLFARGRLTAIDTASLLFYAVGAAVLFMTRPNSRFSQNNGG